MNNLIFKWRDELIIINPGDIVYFQADGNYSFMMLASGKKQLLSNNLSKVQLILEEQLKFQSALFERVGRDLIIRKAYLFSIHILNQKLNLLIPNGEKVFELHVSKDALKKLKLSQEVKPIDISSEVQLRDIQTSKIYPLVLGENRFGRKSTESNYLIDNGDNQISRQHFSVEVVYNIKTKCYKYFLIDSGSTNGTFLNSEQIQKDIPTLLHLGSKIRAGKTEFLLEQINTDRTEKA